MSSMSSMWKMSWNWSLEFGVWRFESAMYAVELEFAICYLDARWILDAERGPGTVLYVEAGWLAD